MEESQMINENQPFFEVPDIERIPERISENDESSSDSDEYSLNNENQTFTLDEKLLLLQTLQKSRVTKKLISVIPIGLVYDKKYSQQVYKITFEFTKMIKHSLRIPATVSFE
jgi:hypothetical protein